MFKKGRIRGEKILYEDGIGCCVWYPFEEDEGSGLCWDFSHDDIDDLIAVLQEMRDAEAKPYKENKDVGPC